LTPNTVVISPALVRSDLVAVSADGSTYTFSSSSGPFGQLKPGKVLLLEGFDAAVVTRVQHSGAKLVVGTTPATLQDVVQSGNIDVSTPPDYSGAFGTDAAVGSVADVVPAGTAVSLARTDEVADRPALPDLSGHGWNYSGKDGTGKLSYSISLYGDSAGLHAYGGFCFSSDGSGNITGTCGGPVYLKGEVNGLVSFQTENAKLAILKGQPPKGSFSLSGLSFKLNVSYTAVRGEDSVIGAKLVKAFTIPFAFEMPVCPPPAFCAGIPLYTKVELSLLVDISFSSKNSTAQGGYTVIVAGSGSVLDQTGFKLIAGSAGGWHVSGKFNPGTSITPGAAAALVALQLKTALGIGIRGLNAMLYLAFISSFGQVTGSAVAGELCQNYYAAFTIKAGAEAQLWIFKIPLAAVTLWSKSENLTQPGC
jgi:hypothetical protein